MTETAKAGALSLVPIEQAVASLITDRIIMRGTPTPAQIQTRCVTANAYAATLTDIAAGNGAQALQDFNAIIANPAMDPVLAADLQALASAGIQQLSLLAAGVKLVPIFGGTAQAFADNLSNGIIQAATLLAAANPVTPPPPPASK